MKDSVSIQIKEIRPDELSAYCHGLTITYGCATSLFGTILVAYVPDGICYLSFVDDNLEEELEELLAWSYAVTRNAATDPNIVVSSARN